MQKRVLFYALSSMVSPGTRLCLNMIVKNEARVIARCIESVRPFISSWVIVDTGSTDQTQEKCRACLRDLPGQLYERPWRNFGDNRTEALELARTHGDYTLIIDADEVLRADQGFVMPDMVLDAYQLRTQLGDISYYRTQIVRSALPWRYAGVLHEYLELGRPFQQARLEGLVNWPQPDGARSNDPQKYAKDAAVLEEALRSEPTNPRYAYYLGQSYRDAGLKLQALDAYRRRVALGGWAEETWSALFEIARLVEALGRPSTEVIAAYLAAYEFRSQRAESLCALARYLRLQNRHELAYLFGKQATEIPRPDDILFVDRSVYDWRATDELSIAAYYVGRHAEAIELTQALLDGSGLPEGERMRVQTNQDFSTRAVFTAMEHQHENRSKEFAAADGGAPEARALAAPAAPSYASTPSPPACEARIGPIDASAETDVRPKRSTAR